jgi:parvulin-like peptidyl-prolyl isomerase
LAASLRRLLREPLVHFVLAGAVLFAAFALVRGPRPSAADDSTIVVDRRALLTYMQYRANAFDAATFEAALDAMSEQDLAQLIDDYVEEEALYREAKTLGLDGSDYVIRQRMIQKIKFLLGDAAAPDAKVEASALNEYFAAHKREYAIEPSVTFTHVFFDAERRGGDEHARADAERAVHELNAAHAQFNDAPGHGDRFPFLKNYVDRTFDYVASQFGQEFAAELATLKPGEVWQGPLRSAYGEHAVLLTRRTELRLPALDEIRDRVEGDYLRERADAELKKLTETVRDRYRVEILDVRGASRP